ncbi:LamG-like jellyroll fold domain-containing protein [Chitinophagaceae bacterium MMS25-I14]
MKTLFTTNLQHRNSNYAKAKTALKKVFTSLILLVGTSQVVQAQFPCNTFVKQVDNIGQVEPRIFRDPSVSNYYLTARSNDSTFISNVNATGTVVTTQIIKFPNDQGTITDMIVDRVDGTLAAVVKGNNRNYMIKYDYATATVNWIMSYPSGYLFQNIHQLSGSNDYVITGEILGGGITIFEVKRTTGAVINFQNSGMTGEFFSAYDGTDVYGACRYYTTPSTIFNPSLFRFDATTGNNLWTTAYIKNVATMRIYPVAPVVDQTNVVQLSSGDDMSFNTYLTGPTKIWQLKTDLGGNINWTNQITISGVSRPNVKKIINTATGYYLLIDSYNSTTGIIDFFYVVKTDKNGNIQWANRYGISGQNTVISGIEDNGYLFLTATSGSYTSANGLLLLKLDPNGMSDPNCSYILKTGAKTTAYSNVQFPKPTASTPNSNPPSAFNITQAKTKPSEKVYCSTTCTSLPCNTLSGSLASGVLAFYPFGYGSLNDVSGNSYNLTNPNTAIAFPVPDRNANPTCAYHFDRGTGSLLTIPASGTSWLNGITTSPFSISLWYRPTNDPNRGVGDYELLVGRGTNPLHCPDTWGEWSVGLYDCRKAVVGFDMYSHWELGGCNMAAITGSWHHLAFIYNGSTYSVYRDGVLSSTSSGPCGAMSANAGPLMLGVDYSGDLDDIVIYNRAITASEVASLMALNGSCCDGVTSSQKTAPAQTTGINTLAQGNVKVYPNPTNGRVSVSAGNAIIRSVAVYSNTGAIVGTFQFNTSEVSVNMNNFASGIYFLKVITDAGTTLEKVVKE